MQMIPFTDQTRLLVLTGAGVSAESGVPTFRGMNGLWEGHRVEEVASPEAFARDPALVWRFYAMRRRGLAGIAPNPAHRALAAIEARLSERFLLVTQNVDGLHAAAGSTRLHELHGNLMRSKCSHCGRPPFDDREAYAEGVIPRCARCDGPVRPDIVWFGEPVNGAALQAVAAFADLPGDLVFLAVGTSGLVYPAAALVHLASQRGGSSWLVNAEAAANAEHFDHVLTGAAGELLPGLLGVAGC